MTDAPGQLVDLRCGPSTQPNGFIDRAERHVLALPGNREARLFRGPARLPFLPGGSGRMHLLYIDESGARSSSGYFVAAGLVVHEQDAYRLGEKLAKLFRELGPGWEQHELHAQECRSGKGPWRRVAKDQRAAVARQAAGILTGRLSSGRSPRLFAVAVDRASFPGIDPVERAYEELFLRVDSYLGRLHAGGDSHRCVAISDETRLEVRLQQLMHAWRTTSGRVRRLSAFAEVPLFADSKATRLLQLADFLGHWVYRFYESGDETVFSLLARGFDTDGGTMHGLVHLNTGRKICPCPGCVTRRR